MATNAVDFTAEPDSITVIIPVYSDYGRLPIIEAVIRRWLCQTLRPEIILTVQTETEIPPLRNLAKRLGVHYIRSLPDYRDGRAEYNIGRLRNAGICIANGKFLYLTDADIFPLYEDYLEKIFQLPMLSTNTAFTKPKMLRLVMDDLDKFLKTVAIHPSIPIVGKSDFCLCQFFNGALQSTSPKEFSLLLDGETYVCTQEEYAYLESSEFDGDKEISFLMKPVFHWGGILVARRFALEVFGYCEKYYQWGFEDDDFHLKLSAVCNLDRLVIPQYDKPLIHFEHPRKYNDAYYRQNQHIYKQRASRGRIEMIREDKLNLMSLMTCWTNSDLINLNRFLDNSSL